jgi:hypothetical protein
MDVYLGDHDGSRLAVSAWFDLAKLWECLLLQVIAAGREEPPVSVLHAVILFARRG